MVGGLRERVREIRRHLTTQPAVALQMARTLREQFPEYPTVYALLGQVYQALGQWEEAERVLQLARNAFPRHRAFEQLLAQLRSRRAPEPQTGERPAEAMPREVSIHGAYGHCTAPLRLIEGAGDATVHLRSALVRLIPGLEFAPLRSETASGTYRNLPPPPPFPPELEAALREAEYAPPPEPLTPLEELARRLEIARIPAMEEAETAPTEEPPSASGSEVPIVTETMARIYEQQGAYELALRVYQELARRNPEKRIEYERAQARLRDRLSHADS